MAFIMKGTDVAQVKKQGIIKRVEALKERGVSPALCIIMVGAREDPRLRKRPQRPWRVRYWLSPGALPEDISQHRLLEEIEAVNQKPEYHGIIVMRPVPSAIRWEAVEEAISPAKDVDCITAQNLAGVFKGDTDVFYPCTAKAVVDMLDHYEINAEGKKAVVIGRSLVVGKPLAMMLLQRNATVTICHSRTRDLAEISSQADILVAAAGTPGLVGPDFVNENSIVLDVGINMVDGKLKGDVDFERVAPLVSMISPVPGGVGSVTTSVLMENIVTAAEKK